VPEPATSAPTPLSLHDALPICTENDDAASDHALGEIAQQHDGRLVGPLQVVEHDQEWLVALDPGQQGVDSLEQLLPDLVRGNFVDRKSTRLNSSHRTNSYAVFC